MLRQFLASFSQASRRSLVAVSRFRSFQCTLNSLRKAGRRAGNMRLIFQGAEMHDSELAGDLGLNEDMGFQVVMFQPVLVF